MILFKIKLNVQDTINIIKIIDSITVTSRVVGLSSLNPPTGLGRTCRISILFVQFY